MPAKKDDTYDYGGPLNEPVKIKHSDGHESFVMRESLPAWEERGWTRADNVDAPESTEGSQPLQSSLQSQAATAADAQSSDKNS